ncbi:hypothetical protein Save01_00213 [Streptomyces avermitilis]
MRMASHTTLPAMPAPPARGPVRAYVPDAALPCRRRPDVFQHPLLENAEAVRGGTPQQRRQYLILLRTARDLCASCPLWAECLQDAVAHAEPSGYTAATTADDRRRLRLALGLGDENGDLPVREAAGPGCMSVPRRLARLRSRTSDATALRPADPALPELERVLDAFDTLQDQLASGQDLLAAGPSDTDAPESLQSHIRPGSRRSRTPRESRNEEPMAAAEAGQRIVFSLTDPAQAVRQAVLGPLIRSALPALVSVEQLAAMLLTVPGGGITPETLRDIREVRTAVTSMLPDDAPDHGGTEGTEGTEGTAGTADAAGPNGAVGAAGVAGGGTVPLALLRPLTGSVSVELAMSDPVAALRRDFLEPLLRDLLSSLANIEKVATMLAATSDRTAGPGDGADDAPLETVRAALRELTSRLPHLGSHTAPAALRPPPHPSEGGHDRRAASVPSIRAAVERAAETFPGAFSARDVLRTLPAGVYGDPAKTISNVLSAMVKSGHLQRLSRGTYTRDRGPGPADGQERAKSA